MARAPRILVISDRSRMGDDPVAAVTRLAGTGGLDAFQWREKDLAPDATYALLERLCTALRAASGTRILVNDRVDIASALSIGVHIPENGVPTHAARAILGEAAIIGRSTHSLDAARRARDEGADYVTFGPVYRTASKIAYGPPRGIEDLRAVAASLTPFPVLALGGIIPERVAECRDAGAHGVAAIGGIWDHPDPVERLALYRAALDR